MSGHVGLCVVYLVDEKSEYIFRQHLVQIQECSKGVPLKLYAGVNRLLPRYRKILEEIDFVQVCQLGPTSARNSDEHAHYLDQLVALAFEDGASRFATLDVDSFPIDPKWVQRCDAMLREGAALVGVLRRENGDVALPHPSFTYFPRSFYEHARPTFGLMRGDERANAFLRETKQPRLDTGAGYAVALHERKLQWRGLLRTNKIDDHPLMAGVYGDMIFHLGGGSRDKVFSVDVKEARRTRPQATLEELWPDIAARNEKIATFVREQIQENFDGYIRRLTGRSPLEPGSGEGAGSSRSA